MDYIFTIDPELEIPLYRQLVDRIQAAIKKGDLPSGEKLPTVQEMSQKLSIARGTIKRAYDELERKGLLEKVQGRGTFVCYEPVNTGSRKEMAMAAIDEMLDRLEKMGLSRTEINIFLNLKLRQRAEQDAKVKVILIDNSPENLQWMSRQLRAVDGVDLYCHQLDSIRQYPYKIGEDFDLLVTTPQHEGYLQSVVHGNKRIMRIVLRPEHTCMTAVIRLQEDARIGILGYSQSFTQQMADLVQCYAPHSALYESVIFTPGMELTSFVQDKDVLLVPNGYAAYFSPAEIRILEAFPGSLICCSWEMDEGSLLYLETKIKRLLDAKSV